MISAIPPAVVFIVGAVLIPFLRGRVKIAYMLILPLISFYILLSVDNGTHWTVEFLDYHLILGRVDRLSKVFGYIFTIISFIGFLFAAKADDDMQHVSTVVYAGAALGVTFAGDVFSLYIFWEIMAVASTFVVLAGRTPAAQKAAFRYIMVHLAGGLSLLAGIILFTQRTGSIEFSHIGLDGLDSYLIFLGIALNAAIPPLHPWLQDAYPEASPTGAVFLSAFTTKSAVYVMARTFAGEELLIYMGAIMTALPIFYAVLENDIRRVLAYSLINQVGFMMCGIGIGTQLAINGTVSHAFCHILYKALLFMSAGAVLFRTGKIRCTDLGGLYKTMPLTCVFCMVGAASISAFPLFSGFVSKSMIISAASHDKLALVWLILQFASAGVFHHAGIKVPYFTFFSEDSGLRPKEAPLHMLIAMGLAAFMCVFLGVYPQPLYAILPYPVDYIPYTAAHVVGQLQLLMFGALAFCLLILSGFYPAELRAINLDTDWFYRKGGKLFYRAADRGLNSLNRVCARFFLDGVTATVSGFFKDGPARLAAFAFNPVWTRTKSNDNPKDAQKKKEALKMALRVGATPIGVSAALATLFLLVLFILI